MKTILTTENSVPSMPAAAPCRLRRFTLKLTLAATAFLLLTALAGAQDFGIHWENKGVSVGKGYLPKLASDGTSSLIEIYQTGTGFQKFQYQTGIEEDSLPWTTPFYIPTSSTTDEIGHSPSAALVSAGIDGDTLAVEGYIEVHQGGQDNGSALWYRAGEGQGDFIYAEPLNWQAAAEYDHGYNPTVALDTIYGVSWPNNNTQVPIVEVHQATVNSSELWFHVGVLKIGSTPSVSLAGSHDTGFSGYAPSVSVADGLAILVYQGSGGSLWYSLGVVNNTTEDIAWGTPVNYATGYNPSVSLLGEQICCWFYGNWDVVEVHQQDHGTGPLTYRMGYMDAGSDFSYPTAVKWGPDSDTEFEASGCYPTVGQAAESGLFEVVVTSSTACGKAANIISSYGVWERTK